MAAKAARQIQDEGRPANVVGYLRAFEDALATAVTPEDCFDVLDELMSDVWARAPETVGLDLWLAAAPLLQARLSALAPTPEKATELSRRELEILRLSAKGLTGAAAARALGVSEATVKFHLAGARRKLGVKNTAEAVARLQALDARPGRTPPD